MHLERRRLRSWTQTLLKGIDRDGNNDHRIIRITRYCRIVPKSKMRRPGENGKKRVLVYTVRYVLSSLLGCSHRRCSRVLNEAAIVLMFLLSISGENKYRTHGTSSGRFHVEHLHFFVL